MLFFTVGEGDVEGVEVDGEGDVEGIQADREGDVEGVQAEANEYGGGKSGGQISLVSTVGEYNDSGFGSSVGGENAVNFATSDGVDNVAIVVNGEEEDGNETNSLRVQFETTPKNVEDN
ncbi:hypothetical protein Goshw_003150 [Gossypium schwendimanii]|uniref:Uncharacterized protein n=1 Tax=Gossypium schwendimanii TaxID=34291 RepID=A0A7J9N862_GOSSC|nr:hypothetical protein [Gossypium schwendimanii]